MTEVETTKVLGLTESDIRVPTQDDKGHGERLWFKIPLPLYNQIGSILGQQKKFQIKSYPHFCRVAVYKLCQICLAQEYDLRSVLGQVDLIREILDAEAYQSAFRGLFDSLSKRISDYIQVGAPGEAARLVLECKKHIDNMPEGFWRRQYKKKLKDDFGQYVRQLGQASLTEFGDDDEGDE